MSFERTIIWHDHYQYQIWRSLKQKVKLGHGHCASTYINLLRAALVRLCPAHWAICNGLPIKTCWTVRSSGQWLMDVHGWLKMWTDDWWLIRVSNGRNDGQWYDGWWWLVNGSTNRILLNNPQKTQMNSQRDAVALFWSANTGFDMSMKQDVGRFSGTAEFPRLQVQIFKSLWANESWPLRKHGSATQHHWSVATSHTLPPEMKRPWFHHGLDVQPNLAPHFACLLPKKLQALCLWCWKAGSKRSHYQQKLDVKLLTVLCTSTCRSL